MLTSINRRAVENRNLSAILNGLPRKPLHRSPSSDIYLVRLDGTPLALKILRLNGHQHDESKRIELFKQVARESRVWFSLSHPNILEIIGFCSSLEEPFVFVSRFMEGGSALEYVRAHPGVDLAALCAQIAEGLRYLHASSVIHGDLKGTNVVIDDSGQRPQALICDFGSSRFMNREGYTTVAKCTLAWTARELLVCNGCSEDATKGSDVWALGMTIYELFTRALPYSELKLSDHQLAQHIVSGGLPPRPAEDMLHPSFDDALWELLQSCWRTKPEERPTAEVVRDCLGGEAVPAVSPLVADLLTVLEDMPFSTSVASSHATSVDASSQGRPSAQESDVPSHVLDELDPHVGCFTWVSNMLIHRARRRRRTLAP